MSWYDEEKVFFKCQKCGKCCKRKGVVNFSNEDIKVASEYLEVSEEDFKKAYLKEYKGSHFVYVPTRGACVFLDKDGECRIHDAKPIQCKTYPFWAPIIKEKRTWNREAIRCRGIGKEKEIDIHKYVPDTNKIKDANQEDIAMAYALISCNDSARVEEDGRCYSQECIFSKSNDLSFKIKKEGCVIYKEARKYGHQESGISGKEEAEDKAS